jgi:putative PIN family toxin of toxin-antitoxin system
MSHFFIIDTNVVVAGFITAQADSPVARILDAMLAAAFPFVLSPALLAEYRAVLIRPKLAKLHGLVVEQIDTVLTDLARHAIVLTPPANPAAAPAPDPGDQFLWNLLALRADLTLVTGDKRLLDDAAMQPRVISPLALVARLHH